MRVFELYNITINLNRVYLLEKKLRKDEHA